MSDWRTALGKLDTVDPTPGLWERARARAAEVPAEPVSFARHRLATIALAAVVAVAGSAALFVAFEGRSANTERSRPATYRDPIGGWQITFPAGFRQGTLPPPSRASQRSGVGVRGVWLANFTPTFNSRISEVLPTLVPRAGVFVEIYESFGNAFYEPDKPDSSFPLSLDAFAVMPGSYKGEWRTAGIVANGEPYAITIRLGPDATDKDRAVASSMVSSLRFLPLRQGTAIGQQQHLTSYVLARVDAFLVGSVTRFDASDLPPSTYGGGFPFYLVRVPRGFYALSWRGERGGGYQDCGVTYDADTRRFVCSNGAMWALDGSVISKPGPRYPDDPLEVLIVRISLDGHVLVSPNVSMWSTNLDLRITGHAIKA